MPSRKLRHILLYETIGFAALVALNWLDEFLDLPHRVFGGPATHPNLVECVFETVLILLVAVVVLVVTHRLLVRLRHLEGFIHICAHCRKVRLDDEWVPLEVFMEQRSDAQLSHGLCSDCLRKHYGDMADPDSGSA